MFTRSAITRPEVNGFGWNFRNSEYVVWSWPWQILGAMHLEAIAGDLAEVLFFCRVNNARLCRFRSAKFHEICTQDVVLWRGESFRNFFFWKFALKGSFFQKTFIIVNYFQLQAAISRKWLQILESDDRLAPLWNVGFPSVSLESTQSHSHGLQAPHEKGLSWTSAAYTEWLSSTHIVAERPCS